MEGTSILGFEWILLFAAIAGILSVRFRMPPVAGLLLAGMLMGPNILNLVDPPTISAFAEIGSVLLLFMIGVEFSVTKLLSAGLRAMMSSFLLICLTFIIMHEAAVLIGFDQITSLFIASIFSMSSTAIMMKILEQKRLVDRSEVPVLVSMLIIEDLAAVFMLTFFSSLKAGSSTGDGFVGAILVSLVVMAFAYLILLRLLKRFSLIFLRYQAEDTLILFAFALGVGMSVLASLVGLTPAIGAFLAGSIIAGLPVGQEVERSIRPFSHVFSSFFFLSVGMLINPATLLVSAELTLMLIAAFMATIFLATAFVFFLISTSGRSSVFAGFAMLPLGEFSLLIAKESVGIVSSDLVGVASVGVLITSLTCSLALERSDRSYVWLKKKLPPKFLDTLRDASGYFRNVVSAFEPGGYFHRVLITELKKCRTDLLYLIGAAVFLFASKPYLDFQVSSFGIQTTAHAILLALLAVISVYPVIRIAISAKRLFDALATIFSRTTAQTNRNRILRNLLISAALFVVFANSSFIVDYLLLPRVFNWLAVVVGMLSLFFFWSAVRASSLILFLRDNRTLDLMKSRIVTSGDDMIFVGGAGPARGAKTGKPKSGEKKRVVFLR
ncbi:MAG: cation:proton antiporter [Candidatus Micrarchaeota archaeon]